MRKLIDTNKRREERTELAEKKEAPVLPNRAQRRAMAKRRGVFKRPGAWGYINTGAKHNVPERKDRDGQGR